MSSPFKARKPPPNLALSLPLSSCAPETFHNVAGNARSVSSTSARSIEDDLMDLERLRLDVDLNLRLRPLNTSSDAFETPLSPSPSAFFTPAIAYFSHASHPLPISAPILFSRMLCSPRPVLLDVRPIESFRAFRLKDAISVSVPSILADLDISLEPTTFRDMMDIHQFISTPEGKKELDTLLHKGRWDGDAVVYDDERQLTPDSPTWTIMEYLLPLVKGQVWYLEGGMSAASTLPNFQLIVVTAEQATPVVTSPRLANTSLRPPDQKHRKRSVPNLRKLDTSAVDSIPKLTIQSNKLPPERTGTLSSRRPNSRGMNLSTSAPPTPRPRSPLQTVRGFGDEQSEIFVLSTILPNFLYLGPEITLPEHVEKLKSVSVKRILNVAIECDDDQGLDLRRVFERYHRIPLKDTVEEENVGFYLREACDFLDDARLHDSPVYVHCKAGKSRSVMAVIGYLIHSHYWTLSKAYAFVLERREGISPNIGFVSELMSFEESELGSKNFGPPSAAVDHDEHSGYHHSLSGKRPANVRESLPPQLFPVHRESEGIGWQEGAQETEVKDAWGRYRHQRRAPVDSHTLQPLRRVSKAGLESSAMLV